MEADFWEETAEEAGEDGFDCSSAGMSTTPVLDGAEDLPLSGRTVQLDSPLAGGRYVRCESW